MRFHKFVGDLKIRSKGGRKKYLKNYTCHEIESEIYCSF